VGGDSAGGTLATLACVRLRDEDPRALPGLQVLLYPNTDLTGGQPSMRDKGTGFGLTASGVRFFSPLRAPDLSGLPPALVVTAEHDPLRDEGEAYARRLADAGVDVELRREPGLIHNFMMLDTVSPACAAGVDRVAADLRRLLTRLPGQALRGLIQGDISIPSEGILPHEFHDHVNCVHLFDPEFTSGKKSS
jgi:acetyl esterase